MFSQEYAFHSGIYLLTTAPDPFNAKTSKKDQGHALGAPRKSPYLQQRVYTASQSSLET